MNPPAASAGGSHLWQLVFISFAVVLVLFEVFRGWNRGIARQLARLGGMIAGSLVAYFGARFLVPAARPIINLPDPTLWVIAAAALFLITYLVIYGTGAVLFKSTKQYESGTARLLCGLGGAICGLFFGAFLVWMIVIGVRSLGSIANAHVREQSANQAAVPDRTLHAVDERRRRAGEAPPDDSNVMVSLARLKNSLELGSVGDLVKETERRALSDLRHAGQDWKNGFKSPEYRTLSFISGRSTTDLSSASGCAAGRSRGSAPDRGRPLL